MLPGALPGEVWCGPHAADQGEGGWETRSSAPGILLQSPPKRVCGAGWLAGLQGTGAVLGPGQQHGVAVKAGHHPGDLGIFT